MSKCITVREVAIIQYYMMARMQSRWSISKIQKNL